MVVILTISCKREFEKSAGGPLLEGLGRIVAPLYFRVTPIRTVAPTKEQCDFAFSYNDGHFELRDAVPYGFPQPGNSSGTISLYCCKQKTR
jgi:hypothetical protein